MKVDSNGMGTEGGDEQNRAVHAREVKEAADESHCEHILGFLGCELGGSGGLGRVLRGGRQCLAACYSFLLLPSV